MENDEAPRIHPRLFAASAALRDVAARVAAGGVITVDRAEGGASGLLLAYLAEQLRRPILCVVAGQDEAERARRDWATFHTGNVEQFPPWESLFEADAEPDPETYAERHAIDDGLSSGKITAVVAPLQALLQPVARAAAATQDRRIVLRTGDPFPTEQLARALVDAGYRRFPQVSRPGDFSIRGGIFDLFPRESAHAYRLEYFGDEIESIRVMSMVDQRSRDDVSILVLTLLRKAEYFMRGFTGSEVTLLARLPPGALLVLASARALEERCRSLIGQYAPRREDAIASEFWAQAARHTRLELESLPAESGRRPVTLPVTSAERFTGSLDRVLDALRAEAAQGNPIEIFFRQLAEAERFREILAEASIPAACRVLVGELSRGFRWQESPGAIFLSGSAILGRTRTLARREARSESRRAQTRPVDSFLELSPGDLVVHAGHGICRFLGMREITEGRRRGDHLVLEFRDAVHLLLPADRIHLVQKYVGGAVRGHLDLLGGTSWGKRRTRVEKAIQDLAAEMLELQALRAERKGFAFPPDTEWQREFEAAFPFQETRDQLTTATAIRADLEAEKPMDRLICGDVGYGKTELAMRAAFKVVQAGKQVAVLVPTTVLAQQHIVTFHDRMAEFPVRIDLLSRFRTREEQLECLRKAREGEVDIVIGTHRLLSKDVSFKDLGLIIIDEEQRFGVAHKETLKQLRRLVDVLTLTATPIPRTLHLALIGVRDISSLHEAPEGRIPIHTEVSRWERERFRDIFLRELNRDGQVFYVHNRVRTIAMRAQELSALLPEARVIHVHGRMEEHELEVRMREFLEKRYDVLVTTTIIESGLDIPSVNTIVIDRADRFGLSELHQLRGRVGRGQHQAYCYLLVPDDRPVGDDAKQRLKAIEEFSNLGAGFQIAIRDLEIRGAGNILGREQSGHIATIGYDLYCRLLERTVARMRGAPWVEPPDVEIALPGYCRIPPDYIPDDRQRLRVYRSVSTALDAETIDELASELVDRYGPLPEGTRQLLDSQALRVALGRWGARRVAIEDGWLIASGDEEGITNGFRGRGWQVVKLPSGEIGGRPPARDLAGGFTDLQDVARLLFERAPVETPAVSSAGGARDRALEGRTRK